MEKLSIEYNVQIGEITGQDKIKQEILYSIHNEKYVVFHIVGKEGTGKTTISEVIATEFITQYKGNVFYLNPAYQKIPEDYSTFKSLLHKNSENKNVLFNIFKESIKDIPYVGNTLSEITSQIISSKITKEDNEQKLEESEQFIISALQKYQKKADTLYICNSPELWDFRSKQLFFHLIEAIENLEAMNKVCYIIISSDKLLGLKKSQIIYKHLHKIEKESLPEIVRQFNSELNMNQGQIEKIHSLTDGNLELIKECVNLFNSEYVASNKNLYDILKSRIEYVVPNESDALLLLLKEMAFIGEMTDQRLLSKFVSSDQEIYEDLIGKATQLSLLSENQQVISFTQKYVYSILQKMLYKDRKYYRRMVKCIKILYPSRYDLQMYYLYRGGLDYEADKNFFIYLISYYRENNIEYNLNYDEKNRLQQNKLYSIYTEICKSYKLYKNKQYTEAENILFVLYTEEEIFRFEIDYLLSLIATNKYNTAEEYKERIQKLQAYTNDDFKTEYPEMYMRAQMMLCEFYAEINFEADLKQSLRELTNNFNRYSATDKQIQCYENCFKMKSNAFYKIEVAEKQTHSALHYFNEHGNKQRYISKYYLALLNHAANEIVLGKFEDSYSLLQEAYSITLQYPHIKTLHEDILLNNIIISGFYSHKYSAKECINAIEILINNMQEQADLILLKNNLAVFYSLSGSYERALEYLSNIYNMIRYNEDIDDYYRYYVLNNYGIQLWIMGQKQSSLKILNYAFALNPLPRDNCYFKTRAEHIRLLVEEKCADEFILNGDWNQYLFIQNPNIVGAAWKFWSSLLLLSELQIWSDY